MTLDEIFDCLVKLSKKKYLDLHDVRILWSQATNQREKGSYEYETLLKDLWYEWRQYVEFILVNGVWKLKQKAVEIASM
jgi:hypothetical protein